MNSGAVHLPDLAASRRRTLERLRAVIVLALVLPVLAFVAVASYLYRDEMAVARTRLDRTTRIAQEHALKLFETNEMLLERMLDLLGTPGDDELLARNDWLHQRLKRMVAELPQVQGLFVHGADSRQLASNRGYPPPRQIDYTDREWYQVHRSDGAGAGVFLTEQIVSRATGEPAFDMSRRRRADDGSFAGTVHVSLRPQYLTDFYQELASTVPGLHMLVLRRDGRLLARWPEPVEPGDAVPPTDPVMHKVLAGLANGHSDGVSPFDGADRLRTFRQLGKYPLYVAAGIDRSVVLADWYRRSALLALFLFPTAGGLAWMAWLALERTREEHAVMQRLVDEKARRQHIELALLRSQKLEAMGRLTGAVAHDFNNLLMVVNSNLYLHRRLEPTVAGSPQLAAIERAVGSGSKLTRQLLAFARKQALMPERTALQERLPALLDLLRPLLGASIDVRCEVAADTREVEVDAAELELALINLAVNARDAMDSSGRLEIAARNATAAELPAALDGPFVVLDVSDSGPGIDPAVIDQVFEPFFTTKPLGQGTGLGLSQVQALCHSAGGAARIENRAGGGARVRLFLAPAGAASEPAAEVAVQPAMQELRCRVLLVEDNEAVAQATFALLESMGCTVQRVDNGRAALEQLRAGDRRYDVVLSDIEMPGDIDGIALAALLARAGPQPPVILMTGYAVRLEEAVRERLEVLPKPCSPAVLSEAIAKALARAKKAAPLATDVAVLAARDDRS